MYYGYMPGSTTTLNFKMQVLGCIPFLLLICSETRGQVVGPFPNNFIWAVATSAYQVEGGWNASGKGQSNWDKFTHHMNPKHKYPIRDNSTGDVACDSYHLWQKDIDLIQSLGVTHYRFSFSWARLLPDGTINHINQDGIDYYNNLINGLLKINVKPMVTLFHFDTPQALENQGGWLNNKSSEWFLDYATFCFKTFGDRVKLWITFNEPWITTWIGYGIGGIAPGIEEPCDGVYTVAHNIIKSHAKAYRAYDEQFRSNQSGMVGITFNCQYKLSGTNSSEDIAAAERSMQFLLGWFAHAIYIDGDYPQIMKDRINQHSQTLGLNYSRLPVFEEWEKVYINGSSDFFGINTYTSQLTFNQPVQPNAACSYQNDQGVFTNQSASWNSSGTDWLKFTPFGIRAVLNWIKDNYGNSRPIIITENGWSDRSGTLDDWQRVEYYKQYLTNVQLAISVDNVNVQGYTAWSLMDNFEWTSGYTEKFGLHYVNFSDPLRPRIPKQSALFYKSVISSNTMDATTNPAPPSSFSPSPSPSSSSSSSSSLTTTISSSAATNINNSISAVSNSVAVALIAAFFLELRAIT